MSSRCSVSVAALLVACLVGGLIGCGTSSGLSAGDAREAKGVLKVVGVEYARFMAEHNGRPPQDKGEFVAFLETRKSQIAGLTDVSQLFVSPRDNQPFVIFYGKTAPPADESGLPIVAREASGAAGSCLVANTRGGVQEVAMDQLPTHLAASQ